MNLRRLLAVMTKELRQMRRDRITLAMIVGIPVMQLLLFGYAINTNLRDLSAGIADQARTSASRALVADIVATGVVAPTREAATPQELVDAMRRGEKESEMRAQIVDTALRHGLVSRYTSLVARINIPL